MGKVLSGELSCTRTGLVWIVSDEEPHLIAASHKTNLHSVNLFIGSFNRTANFSFSVNLVCTLWLNCSNVFFYSKFSFTLKCFGTNVVIKRVHRILMILKSKNLCLIVE